MDRHSQWLRRRIIASVLSQTAVTAGVVAVVFIALLVWRTGTNAAAAIPAGLVVGQIVAVGRIVHGARANALSYRYMQRYIAEPFRYQVAELSEEPHPATLQLAEFHAVATITDPAREPAPVFDVMHDTDRRIAATIGRASGQVSFSSSLADGRILVTDSRVVPPHELIVVNTTRSKEVASVLEAHLAAMRTRADIVALAPGAHQVSIDLLMLEHETYRRLGPLLAPFLDLEPRAKSWSPRSWTRLSARISSEELQALSDSPAQKARASGSLTAMQLLQQEIARALP